MCVVSVFQRCFQCWSFHGHIFWIFSPWRHFLKFYVLKVFFDTKSSSPAQNLNVCKSGICSIFELFNKIQRKLFAKRFTHKSEYILKSVCHRCVKLLRLTGGSWRWFGRLENIKNILATVLNKIFQQQPKNHAIDVRSSPVVRSAECVEFTGDVFSNVFNEISWVCAKRLENLFDLHIFGAFMVGFECEAKINRSISKMAVICYFSSLEDLIRWNEVTFIFIFLLTKYK